MLAEGFEHNPRASSQELQILNDMMNLKVFERNNKYVPYLNSKCTGLM